MRIGYHDTEPIEYEDTINGEPPKSYEKYLELEKIWRAHVDKDYEKASPEEKLKVKLKLDKLEAQWGKYRQKWHNLSQHGTNRRDRVSYNHDESPKKTEAEKQLRAAGGKGK